jgi:hypothetical protein
VDAPDQKQRGIERSLRRVKGVAILVLMGALACVFRVLEYNAGNQFERVGQRYILLCAQGMQLSFDDMERWNKLLRGQGPLPETDVTTPRCAGGQHPAPGAVETVFVQFGWVPLRPGMP